MIYRLKFNYFFYLFVLYDIIKIRLHFNFNYLIFFKIYINSYIDDRYKVLKGL